MKYNRLIDGFKRQTTETILKHMNELAKNNLVYSIQLKDGLDPKLHYMPVYIYCSSNNVVIVALDHSEEITELADEEDFFDKPPLYFSETSHRISPVWLMTETIKALKQRLETYNVSRKLYGVMLTDGHIINAIDMEKIWTKLGVKVFNDMPKNLLRRKIKVNPDESLTARLVADIITGKPVDKKEVADKIGKKERKDKKHSESSKKTGNPEHSEKPKCSEQFGNSANSENPEKTETPKRSEYPEPSESSNPPYPDFTLPDDEIAQNNNSVVKVEILRPIPNPRRELEKLVGCADIKTRMDELLALTRYNKMMHEMYPNYKQHEVALHSIFLGRPGTGKTTVCKIFGSLLREAGALSKGHVVVCDRGTFIGTLWGDEERSMRQALKIAQGGVLMIDEAYLLDSTNHDNDPGRLVIQLLMNVLADETQRDIAVVLCGYKEPMMKLLETNPGLLSRFPNRFEFNDFTVEELLEISNRRVGEYHYHFTRQAWEKFRQVLTDAYQVRDPQTWGNARFVANQLDRIYIQHATRCVREQPVDKEQLLTLTPADILPIEVPRSKPRIGF